MDSDHTSHSTEETLDLRCHALEALLCADPDAKCQQVRDLQDRTAELKILPSVRPAQPCMRPFPGRPDRPHLVEPGKVPHRSAFTAEGRAALLHAICHIEFNAINLALDAVWRFNDMPEAFYKDWLRVAAEEAYHFGLLRDHLRTLERPEHPTGWDYGDFEAHNGLWSMCQSTAEDIVARMALVPRTLEARGLDATPLIQAKLRQVNTPDSLQTVALLDIILRDEVGHVAIGNHWYRWLCERDQLNPVAHYRTLSKRYNAPRLKPPFNTEARQAAGFTTDELVTLMEV